MRTKKNIYIHKKNKTFQDKNKTIKKTLSSKPSKTNIIQLNPKEKLIQEYTKKFKLPGDKLEALDFSTNRIPDYWNECNVKEYLELLKPENNYKNYYKDADSQQQFNALVTIAKKHDPIVYSRLMLLITARINPIFLGKINDLLMFGKRDDYIYNELYKLYNSNANKYSKGKKMHCAKNKILVYKIIYKLKRTSYNFDSVDNKYLDVGSGNLNFTEELAKKLNIKKGNGFGIDVGDFSEHAGDWGAGDKKGIVDFKKIKINTKYPFEDNTFDIMSMKMVLHHIQNIDFTMNEIKRTMKPGGIFVLIDTESFSYADDMLTDIEHLLYVNVYNRERGKSTVKKNKTYYKDILGYTKYRNWLEIGKLFHDYSFQVMDYALLNFSLEGDGTPTKSLIAFFKLNKE